jgi:ABC-type dipeptide/oligopeptide/nickel transport system permease component
VIRYLALRLALLAPVLVLVSVVVSLLIYLIPGDPVRAMFARSGATPEAIANIRRQMGLDEPWPVQYVRFVQGMLTGEIRSVRTRTPVVEDFLRLLPSTLELAVASVALAAAVAIPLGALAAARPRSALDYGVTGFSALAISVPNFWLALLLMFLFAQQLAWFPATGGGSPRHLVLPALVLAVEQIALIAGTVRAHMLEVLREDYVRTARAKGLAERGVVWGHAFRNALIPTITILGLNLGYLLSSAVVVESIFARPGIGRMIVDGILAKDFPVVQGAVLLVAVLYLGINMLTDALYAAIDPRLRTAS